MGLRGCWVEGGEIPPPGRILFLGFRSPKRRLPREFMNKNFLKSMPNIFVNIT
jgi:hypothetical protein